ncbi:M3 family metallopeptidase [Aliikangiella maris]|uniref:oligopeptidase A n=2 Tax=Aliikangiella maris TaxID=3162458 RepID=A0ABV2BR88_9GAMM
MQTKNKILAVTVSAILLGCSNHPATDTPSKPIVMNDLSESSLAQNTLLSPWQGPYQGLPAFDKVKLSDLKPALREAIKRHLAEIEAIVNNPAKPTFENTIVALERSGQDFDRVSTYQGIWNYSVSTPEFRKINAEMAPELSAYWSKISQNEKLFARIQSIYQGSEFKKLNSSQQRVVELIYDSFAHNGATLKGNAKKRYAEINQQLAKLHNQFAANLLADEEKYVVFLDQSQLGGLPPSIINAAASAAKERGKEGSYAITNTRSSMDPFLTYSDERELREKVWHNYYNRGDNGDANDNNQIISQILKLRHERVQLLGYKNYAAWRLSNRMAKTPENALNLLRSVWPAAVGRVKEEVADMQVIADKQGMGDNIKPWDYRYYAEKVRKAKYDLDSDEVKQYLQLDKLTEAMFYVAERLFQFKFTPIKSGVVPVFHSDVKVWEVTNSQTGEHIGLWYLDPFARKGKRSGAWAYSYRSHTTFDGKQNVLSSNSSNFIKGAPGEATLVPWSDAETFFHEFGHALHALASNVEYPTLNSGVRDYTEFQSQLLERWLMTDEVINQFLVHYKTGQAMPAELVKKIKKAATFNSGFTTTEAVASAFVDLMLHTQPPTDDPDKFEREALASLNMPAELVMRHRTPHFGHIFSSEGYSAGYYGYLWSEVLTSDAAEAFANAPGGFYDKEMSDKLVKHLFSIRNKIDPADAYRAFRGRDATVDALMRDRGFPLPDKK